MKKVLFLLVLTKLSLFFFFGGGRTGHWAIILIILIIHFPISKIPEIRVARQLVRQLVCIMFTDALFYLWWKEKLVKNQKVSKYYDQDCSYKIRKNILVLTKKYICGWRELYILWNIRIQIQTTRMLLGCGTKSEKL